MSQVVNKMEHGAQNDIYNGNVNIEPNNTSATDPYSVGLTRSGNPAFAAPPITCPSRFVSSTVLTTPTTGNYGNFVSLSGASWNADVTVDTSYFLPSRHVIMTTISGAARTYTTPTAEAIVSLIGTSLKAGSYWEISWVNLGSVDLNIAAGVGVTLVGRTSAILANTTRRLIIRLVDMEPGAEAVTIFMV